MHWINVKDRLPNVNNEYLIIYKDITETFTLLNVALFTTSYMGGQNPINANSFYTVTKFGVKPVPNVTFWCDKKEIEVPEGVILDG